MRSGVIFDIDGTISDHNFRVKFAKLKDYGTYYSMMHMDKPIEESVELMHMYKEKGYAIFLVTGRPENYRKVTLNWLADHRIPNDVLLMRPEDNRTAAAMCKLDLYFHNLKDKFKIRAAYDDDPSVIGMWEELGIRTFQLFRGLK